MAVLHLCQLCSLEQAHILTDKCWHQCVVSRCTNSLTPGWKHVRLSVEINLKPLQKVFWSVLPLGGGNASGMHCDTRGDRMKRSTRQRSWKTELKKGRLLWVQILNVNQLWAIVFFFFLQLLSSLFVQDDSFSKIVILNKKLFLGHISNPFISLYIFVILETVKMCKSGTDVTHQSFHFSFAVFFHNVQGCF